MSMANATDSLGVERELGGLGVQRSVVPVEDHILEVAVGTSVCSLPTLSISVWSGAPVR